MKPTTLFILTSWTLLAIFTFVVRSERSSHLEINSIATQLNAGTVELGARPTNANPPADLLPAGFFGLSIASKFVVSLLATYLNTGQEQSALILQGCAFLLLGLFSLKRARGDCANAGLDRFTSKVEVKNLPVVGRFMPSLPHNHEAQHDPR